LVFSTERNLTEHGEKISAALKGEIEAAMAAAKSVKDSNDLEDVKAKKEALSAASLKIGQEIYGGGSGGSSGGSETDTDKDEKDDKAEEADFKEKK
jgi:molecular chaperone DnaK